MTREQLEAIREVRAEINATRERIVKGNLPPAEKQVEVEHQVELTKKLVELEEAAKPPPAAPNAEIAKLSREEAAKRAAAIRGRPEYWKADTLDKESRPVITREAHEALRRELGELDARSAEAPESGAGA